MPSSSGISNEPLDAQTAWHHFAIAVDRAQGMPNPHDLATDVWAGMITGHWMLVSHFCHKGRLYLLTRRVAPDAAWAMRLPPCEVRAIQFALDAKYPNQSSLAKAMRISGSTLATHLARAMKKLGVRSRAELLAVFCFQPSNAVSRKE